MQIFNLQKKSMSPKKAKILVMNNEPSDSDENIFSEQNPASSQEEIKFKFKSISNFRTRKGSEDIALNNSTKNNGTGSFTPVEAIGDIGTLKMSN